MVDRAPVRKSMWWCRGCHLSVVGSSSIYSHASAVACAEPAVASMTDSDRSMSLVVGKFVGMGAPVVNEVLCTVRFDIADPDNVPYRPSHGEEVARHLSDTPLQRQLLSLSGITSTQSIA